MNIKDKVRLINTGIVAQETSNWIEKENSNPILGDIFTVQAVTKYSEDSQNVWIRLEELILAHPANKFQLIIDKKEKKMTTKEYKKLFIKFLKKHHILEQFRFNLKEYNLQEKRTCFKELFNQDKSSYIIEAFTWRETLQRSEYWPNLNIKWQEHLLNLKA